MLELRCLRCKAETLFIHCFFALAKEPNALNLQVEKLQKNVLDKYKIKRRRHHVYKAAARLWGQGVDFNEALGIVEFAFDAATTEADN